MLFGTAYRIREEKLDRLRGVGDELDPHRAEYEALNHRFRVGAHSIWVHQQADGALIALNLYEIDPEGLRDMGRREWDLDSAYDRWWIEWVGDVYGVDLLSPSPARKAPEEIFSWTV